MSDVFNTETTEPTDVVSSLVGEDKKFKSLEDLAKGKIESDNYIEQLKAELEAERNKAAEATKLQELIDKLDNQSNPAGGESEEEPAPAVEDHTSLTAEELKKLVNETLTETQKEQLAKSNREKASQALVDKYGDKAGEELNRIANEMGVTKEFLSATAEQSPNAFFKLIGLEATASTNTFTQPEVRTVTTAQSANKRDYAYYRELRKKDSNFYYSPKIQNQMLKDREELGEAAFYGT